MALPVRPSEWRRGSPIPITAMGVGQLLDAAIHLYRLHWKSFMALAAYIVVPLAFIEAAWMNAVNRNVRSFDPATGDFGDIADEILISFAFIGVRLLLVTPFLTAAFARAAATVYLGGQPVVAETYRFALSKLASVLLVMFLTTLAVIGGSIALIVPGIIFYLRFAFGPPVVVVEDLRGTKAMGRSWRLVKGDTWRVLGILFLAGIISSVVGGIVNIPLLILGNAIPDWGWIVTAVGSAAAEVLTQPFATIISILLYFDLRIRKEGFDLALMAQEIGSDDG